MMSLLSENETEVLVLRYSLDICCQKSPPLVPHMQRLTGAINPLL